MLNTLKFVQGAVAKKDFAPALTHFRIHARNIKGFNGSLALSSPIDCDLDIYPKATQFVQAIAACTDTIAMHVAPNGKLVIRSGKFKAFIDCDDGARFPDILPTGKMIKLTEPILPALEYLAPFIADDASRPWACGILLDGESAYSTNNIVLVQYWLGFEFPYRVNIPKSAVQELLRIGDNPTMMQMSENRISFHYEDGRWLSTQLFEAQWPDVAELLNRHVDVEQSPFPEGLWEAIDQLAPFCGDLSRCFFLGDHIATVADSEVAGARVSLACPQTGVFNIKQLSRLRDIAKTIAFESYPNPVPFFGDRCRGIIVGIKP